MNYADADEDEVVSCRNKSSPRESDGVVGACSCKDLTPLVILDEGTVDHSCYIKSLLLVALKYGNEVFNDKWIFQQDGARPRGDHLTEEWCSNNFPSLIDKNHWPSNSSNMNPMNYSI